MIDRSRPVAAIPVPANRPEPPIAVFRLYLLRLAYVVMALGLGAFMVPDLFDYTEASVAQNGVRTALFAGFVVLAILGLRYPLKLIPLLLLEFTWKTIYLLCYFVPLWRAGQLTGDIQADAGACMMGAIFIPLFPWDYAIREYVLKPGDRWW